MHDRAEQQEEESALLARESEKHPELFEKRTFIEDDTTLRAFGIRIPGKEHLPTGMVKVWPEDFIVEEVDIGGTTSQANESAEQRPDEEGNTVFATLVKCGVSTLQAVEDIADALGVRKEQIAYAGIKDRDAITAQQISIRGATLDAVQRLTSPYFLLKDIRTGKGVVEKGRLKGNRFTILIRTLDSLREGEQAHALSRALRRTNEEGFYNFFYLQRFGTPRLRNFIWARHLLTGEDDRALADFLTYPAEREIGFVRQLRSQIAQELGNWDAVLRLMRPFPLMFRHELKVVDHLLQKPGDIAGAFRTIPDQIVIWMYALSSVYFNEKISQFLERGIEPPERLPFFLSPRREDQELYRDLLERDGLSPVPLHNLRRFPEVQTKSHSTSTKDRVLLKAGEVLDEGLLLQFELGKGQYATTYLSHLFNLASGNVPSTIPSSRIDVREALGQEPLQPLITRFDSIINSKEGEGFQELER